MSIREAKELTQELYQALNAGKSNVEDFFAPDYRNNTPPPGLPNTLEGFRQVLATIRVAFPDIRWTIEDLIAEGDRVSVRLTISGTHRGRYEGVAPTGRHFSISGVDMFKIRNGKIVEAWHQRDTLDLWEQLGAVPRRARQQEAGS